MDSDASMSEGGKKCDSCSKIVDVLIPIRILSETKGGMEMQLRHYCPHCFMDMVDDWELDKGDKEGKYKDFWLVVWETKNGNVGYSLCFTEEEADKIYNETLNLNPIELFKAEIKKQKMNEDEEKS